MELSCQKKEISEDKKKIFPEKVIKSLASSIYQTLKDEGCENKDIIGVSSQLLDIVTSSIGDLPKD